MEWAGAFGDLGTLILFVIAYTAVLKMNPSGSCFPLWNVGLDFVVGTLLQQIDRRVRLRH
jgi:hypothetical protein